MSAESQTPIRTLQSGPAPVPDTDPVAAEAPLRRGRIGLAVVLTVALPLVVTLLVVSGLSSADTSYHAPEAATTLKLLVAIAVVAAAALVGGRIAELLGQPPVIGEICAGIMLGPTLLGRVAPQTAAWLFPAGVLPMLKGLAEIGVVLFMFQVGRELAATRIRGSAQRAPLVGAASVLGPFAAGVMLAAGPASGHAGDAANPMAYAIFVGCALSVTALPVLARILADLGMARTRIGQLSLLTAALGDGAAWLLLALALITASGGSTTQVGQALLLAVAAALLLLGPVRWALHRMIPRDDTPAGAGELDDARWQRWAVCLVILVAASAAFTAAVGIHQIIGALLAGLVFPRSYRPMDVAATRLADTSKVLLLPVFFAGFGLSVDLGALPLSWEMAGLGSLVLAAAIITKLAGPSVAARLSGLGWRESMGVGALLNARGLTELVVIGIGWEAGIIDAQMMAILVIVTLITTMLTGPLMHLLGFARERPPGRRLFGLPAGIRATGRDREVAK